MPWDKDSEGGPLFIIDRRDPEWRAAWVLLRGSDALIRCGSRDPEDGSFESRNPDTGDAWKYIATMPCPEDTTRWVHVFCHNCHPFVRPTPRRIWAEVNATPGWAPPTPGGALN